MALLIDAGNTRIKSGVFVNGEIKNQQAISHFGDVVTIFRDLFQQTAERDVVLVHVLGADVEAKIRSLAEQSQCNLLIVGSELRAYGVETDYRYPEKLGSDRFVAMVAAHHASLGQACLVVDCGTAVTIDAVTESGKHLGGLILPGLQLCEDSLINRAKNLTKINQSHYNEASGLFARDTQQGISGGCRYSLLAAIERICEDMIKELAVSSSSRSVKKFICGGDATMLYQSLTSNFELQEYLVLDGLRYIAEQNK